MEHQNYGPVWRNEGDRILCSIIPQIELEAEVLNHQQHGLDTEDLVSEGIVAALFEIRTSVRDGKHFGLNQRALSKSRRAMYRYLARESKLARYAWYCWDQFTSIRDFECRQVLTPQLKSLMMGIQLIELGIEGDF